MRFLANYLNRLLRVNFISCYRQLVKLDVNISLQLDRFDFWRVLLKFAHDVEH